MAWASKLTRGRTEKMDMVQELSEEGAALVVFPQLWNETFWERTTTRAQLEKMTDKREVLRTLAFKKDAKHQKHQQTSIDLSWNSITR